jgi:hypothetical protein
MKATAIGTQKSICQSCASPVLKEADKGTEKDGSTSPFYCRRCFMTGDFTDLKMTVEKMHEIVRVKMVAMKFPRFLSKQMANNVYTLKRWAVPKG